MIQINYVTSSPFKQEEIRIIEEKGLINGELIKQTFKFNIYETAIHERLEVDLERMVAYEVKEAYSILKIPCIVEHAGLVFEKYKESGYPGGLTKPMWNTLGADFLCETNSSNQPVIARAVIGYCDGKTTKIFVGETTGLLADSPRGKREFYWDTIFIPEQDSNLTYAEIVAEKGIEEKILKHSQSFKALVKFLQFIRNNGMGDFWR